MSDPFKRICNRCKCEKTASPEFFPRDSTRPLGLGYECRPCQSERKAGTDKRTDRWSSMTEEQRLRSKANHRRYWSSVKGRAVSLATSYEKIDRRKGHECDVKTEWILENIFGKSCTYCGIKDAPIGCDRIDNSRGHTMDNVVPCCTECNLLRGDRFTPEEMQIIGKAVAKVYKKRGQYN